IRGSQAPRHVFNVGVETTVFVDDQDGGDLSRYLGGTNVIAANAAVAIRRRHGDVLGLEPLVVGRDLLRERVVGPEALPKSQGGYAADRELLRAIEECTAVDLAVNVTVEQVQQLLRIIRRFFSFHW